MANSLDLSFSVNTPRRVFKFKQIPKFFSNFIVKVGEVISETVHRWGFQGIRKQYYLFGEMLNEEEFREKWDKKYPNILKSRDRNWAELTVFFENPQEIRKIIYTTYAVESYHRMVRNFTKSKSILFLFTQFFRSAHCQSDHYQHDPFDCSNHKIISKIYPYQQL